MPRSNSYFIGEQIRSQKPLMFVPDNTFMFFLRNKKGEYDLWQWKYHLENSIDSPRKKQKALRKLRAIIEKEHGDNLGMWY